MDLGSGGPVALTGERLRYDGRAGAFLKIHLVNLLLSFLTAGIFRFWARTLERRYVWSRTGLLGDWFEYAGTGKELFVGFLKALALIAVLAAAFYAAGFMAVLIGRDEAQAELLAWLFQLPAYVLFYYLSLLGAFAARRYRMSRTLWRGIRFQQQGSPFAYANRGFVGMLICLLTLGLYYPVLAVRLRAYEIDNLRFGTLAFRFNGDHRALWRAFLVAWAIGMGFLGAMGVIFGPAIVQIWRHAPDPLPPDQFPQVIFLLPAAYFAALFLLPLAWSGFAAAMLRHVAERTMLGDLRFRCEATGWRLFRLWLGNALITIFTLGLLRPLVVNRGMRFLARHYAIDGTIELAAVAPAPAGPTSGEGLAGYLGIDALPG